MLKSEFLNKIESIVESDEATMIYFVFIDSKESIGKGECSLYPDDIYLKKNKIVVCEKDPKITYNVSQVYSELEKYDDFEVIVEDINGKFFSLDNMMLDVGLNCLIIEIPLEDVI